AWPGRATTWIPRATRSGSTSPIPRPSDPGAGPARPVRPHVVLLPGLGLDERAWARVRSSLPSPTTVVRLPAMGTRPAAGTGVSVDALAGALSSALDAATGADPVVLVGLSASCPVAGETARRDHRVAGLVLVGPVTDPRGRTWP